MNRQTSLVFSMASSAGASFFRISRRVTPSAKSSGRRSRQLPRPSASASAACSRSRPYSNRVETFTAADRTLAAHVGRDVPRGQSDDENTNRIEAGSNRRSVVITPQIEDPLRNEGALRTAFGERRPGTCAFSGCLVVPRVAGGWQPPNRYRQSTTRLDRGNDRSAGMPV